MELQAPHWVIWGTIHVEGEEYTPDYALPYIYPGWLEIWNFFICLIFCGSFFASSLFVAYFVCRIFLWIHRRQLCSTLYIPCLVRDGTTQKLLDFSFTEFTEKILLLAFIWHICYHVDDVDIVVDVDDVDDVDDGGHSGIILLTLPRVTLILPN